MKQFNRRQAERELTTEIADAVAPLEGGYVVEVGIDDNTPDWVRMHIDVWNRGAREGLQADITIGGGVHPQAVVAAIIDLFKSRRTALCRPIS